MAIENVLDLLVEQEVGKADLIEIFIFYAYFLQYL